MKGFLKLLFKWCWLILLGIEGCAHLRTHNDARDKGLTAYYPLSTGNSWTYQTSFQGQPQTDLTVSIVKEEKGYFIDNGPTPSHLRFDAEGLRDGMIRYLLRRPVKTGTKWMSVVDVRTVEHYEILSTNETVKVPAGSFRDCVVVRMQVNINETRSMENQMTFAPDVGMIEIQTTFKDGLKRIPQAHMALKSFQLKTAVKQSP